MVKILLLSAAGYIIKSEVMFCNIFLNEMAFWICLTPDFLFVRCLHIPFLTMTGENGDF